MSEIITLVAAWLHVYILTPHHNQPQNYVVGVLYTSVHAYKWFLKKAARRIIITLKKPEKLNFYFSCYLSFSTAMCPVLQSVVAIKCVAWSLWHETPDERRSRATMLEFMGAGSAYQHDNEIWHAFLSYIHVPPLIADNACLQLHVSPLGYVHYYLQLINFVKGTSMSLQTGPPVDDITWKMC